MFRGANEQKDKFRRDPNSPEVAHIKYIQTQRGTRLMVSGWWGVARHGTSFLSGLLLFWFRAMPVLALDAPPRSAPAPHFASAVNYTGDWLMGLAWCLTAGYGSPIPFFYCLYFAVLLVHRAIRDDAACRHKYGADWDRYCSIVRYCLIPGVY